MHYSCQAHDNYAKRYSAGWKNLRRTWLRFILCIIVIMSNVNFILWPGVIYCSFNVHVYLLCQRHTLYFWCSWCKPMSFMMRAFPVFLCILVKEWTWLWLRVIHCNFSCMYVLVTWSHILYVNVHVNLLWSRVMYYQCDCECISRYLVNESHTLY